MSIRVYVQKVRNSRRKRTLTAQGEPGSENETSATYALPRRALSATERLQNNGAHHPRGHTAMARGGTEARHRISESIEIVVCINYLPSSSSV